MTTTSLLLENIQNLFIQSSVLSGGKLNSKNSGMETYNGSPKNSLLMIFLILLLLLIKGFIVYLVYNSMMPKLIYSLSSSDRSFEDIQKNFNPITFVESILLVILFQTLFTN
jgi:hypothetical protein